MSNSLMDYIPVVGKVAISQLQQLAEHLQGAKVVHVNSTKEGGGVAEILNWLIPVMNELGLDASWEVINGNEEYFRTTKSFHNGLQGNPTVLSPMMKQGIGMAYLNKGYWKKGTEIFIKIRNKTLKAEVVKLPIYKG